MEHVMSKKCLYVCNVRLSDRGYNNNTQLTAGQTEVTVKLNHLSIESCKVFFAASSKLIDGSPCPVVHHTIDAGASLAIAIISDV